VKSATGAFASNSASIDAMSTSSTRRPPKSPSTRKPTPTRAAASKWPGASTRTPKAVTSSVGQITAVVIEQRG
jgi:hypothetical protein